MGKGLQFMNDAKVVHHNLTPDAIFVNAKVNSVVMDHDTIAYSFLLYRVIGRLEGKYWEHIAFTRWIW